MPEEEEETSVNERTDKPAKCRMSNPETGYLITCVWLSNYSDWCAKYGRELDLMEENPPEWCEVARREE